MRKANQDLKNYAKSKEVYLYEVAERMNIQDSNFSRMLRKPLEAKTKQTIIEIIDAIAREV